MTEKEAVDVAKILKAVQGGAGTAARYVAGTPKRLASVPGALGGFTLNTARRAGNVLGDVGEAVTRGFVENVPTSSGVGNAIYGASQKMKGLGTKTVGALQRGAEKLTGVGHHSNFNPLNMATGAGVIGAGYSALRGKAPAPATAPASVPSSSPASSGGLGGLGGLSRRGMEMWNSLPTEARYAIGAGVPLALLGGVMGRKGGLGGLGLGALGLGAAALGGASGGAFGEGARRATGKMLYNVGSFFGGKSDPASQIGTLAKLSPEMGATVLMGRDPNLSPAEARQQYEFLTKNRDMITRMLPTLEAKKASAADLLKTARCWKGYEPVPGKAPYSEDSCRPVGSKKKKKEEKKAGTSVYKLTEKQPEAVVDGKKPTSEGQEKKVTRAEPAKSEDLRPEEVQPSKA